MRQKIISEICKQVGIKNNNLRLGGKIVWLWKGDGYWWFMYDSGKRNGYATKTIHTMYLKDMTLDNWVADGVKFVKICMKRGI